MKTLNSPNFLRNQLQIAKSKGELNKVCRTVHGDFYSGYDDPRPSFVAANLTKKEIFLDDPIKFALKDTLVKDELPELSWKLTDKIRKSITRLPQVYRVNRLWQRLLKTYDMMPAHPIPAGGDYDYMMFHDKLERDYKIDVTERLLETEDLDLIYPSLCLFNTDHSRTFPVANLIHAGGPMVSQEGFNVNLISAYGESVMEFIKDKLNNCNPEECLPSINQTKGLGFYSFHPDGSALTLSDRYVTVPSQLTPKLMNGKPYDDFLNAYRVSDTTLLRLEWMRSDRMTKIMRFFCDHNYVEEDPSTLVEAIILGAAMVQLDGERRNQSDTWKNKDDLTKGVQVWRKNAVAKDRLVCYETEPGVFTSFRRDDAKFEDYIRDLVGFDSHSGRARPVKGGPSTTIASPLNMIARAVLHHLEGSAVGFPSAEDYWSVPLRELVDRMEQEGYVLYWLRTDDENSEQLSTANGFQLSHMYSGGYKTIHDNATLTVCPSLEGPLVTPYALSSGNPFTTHDNVFKGTYVTIRNLHRGQIDAQQMRMISAQVFKIFEKEDPLSYIQLIKDAVRWAPRLGTDDQIQPLFIHKSFIGPRFDDWCKQVIAHGKRFYTNIEIGKSATGYGCVFDGANITVDSNLYVGKFDYFELNKKQKSAMVQLYVMSKRFEMMPPSQQAAFDAGFKNIFGVTISSVDYESWFLNNVIKRRGYDISDLYNDYSPKDRYAYEDLARRLGFESHKYPIDAIGPHFDVLINKILKE